MSTTNRPMLPRALFDDIYYAARYGDSGSDAYAHYATIGCLENRQPNLHFAPGWFRRTWPQSAGRNLLEFVCEAKEDIFPNPVWRENGWAQDRLRDAAELSGKVRTTAIIGLFGSGRTFLNEMILSDPVLGILLQGNLDSLGTVSRFPVICSGHATLSVPSALQVSPEITRRNVVAPLMAGHLAVVFIMRHPLDALLSNWAWWRHCGQIGTYHGKGITGIFASLDDFYADLEANLPVFATFARTGAVEALVPGSAPYLSFRDYLRETVEWMDTPRVATMRFEDLQVRGPEVMTTLANALFIDEGHSLPFTASRSKNFAYKNALVQVPGLAGIIDSLMTSDAVALMARMGYEI